MEGYRSILEVQKFLPFDTVFHASCVNVVWNRASASSELWQQIAEDLGIVPSDPSADIRLNLISNITQRRTLVKVSSAMRLYRCDTERWSRKIETKPEIQCLVDFSAVFLPDASLLMTGGQFFDKKLGAEARRQFKRVYAVNQDGSFTRFKNMRDRRKSHGLLVLEGHVYAFGGRGVEQIVATSEKLELSPYDQLQTRNWTELPEMLAPRHSFNPCACRNRVYLCGGDSQGTCEVFDTKTESFLGLNLHLSTSTRSACSFLLGDELLVLTAEQFYRYNLKTGKEPEVVQHEKHLAFGQMNPVMFGDGIYILNVSVKPRVWIYNVKLNSVRESVAG